MPLFLRATNTANFCILTHSHIYDFYPKLTSRRINVTTGTWTNGHEKMGMYFVGVRSHYGTINWEEPCGTVCPIQLRFTRGLKGVGVLRWGGFDRMQDTGYDNDSITTGTDIEYSNHLWRLGEWCRNSHCPNNGRKLNLLY